MQPGNPIRRLLPDCLGAGWASPSRKGLGRGQWTHGARASAVVPVRLLVCEHLGIRVLYQQFGCVIGAVVDKAEACVDMDTGRLKCRMGCVDDVLQFFRAPFSFVARGPNQQSNELIAAITSARTPVSS